MQCVGVGIAQFVLDMLGVCFDGLATYAEFFRDLTGTMPRCEEREDLEKAIETKTVTSH